MKLEDMSVEELRAVMDRIAYSEGTAREIFEILARRLEVCEELHKLDERIISVSAEAADLQNQKLAAAQRCPEGYVCVPEEPTEEMLKEGGIQTECEGEICMLPTWNRLNCSRCQTSAKIVYKAMLKAAKVSNAKEDEK